MKILLPALIQYRVNRGSRDPWESGIEAFLTVTTQLEKAGVIKDAKVETSKSNQKSEDV